MSVVSNRRNKNLPFILNKIEANNNAQPISSSNLPVRMLEDKASTLSSNFGTERETQEGKCLVFNASSYFTIVANNGDISSVSALDETGAIVALTATYDIDKYVINGVDGNKYWNVKAWGIGATPTDIQKKAYTLAESVEADLFTWLKADSKSTTTLYKAYSGGINATIQNYYSGFWGTQNIYSWQNEVGYTDNAGVLIPRDESITLPPFKDVLGNDLQYIGRCPSRAKFVTPCFKGDGAGYLLSNTETISGDFNISFYYQGTKTSPGSGWNSILGNASIIENGIYLWILDNAELKTEIRIGRYTGGSQVNFFVMVSQTISNPNNDAVFIEINRISGATIVKIDGQTITNEAIEYSGDLIYSTIGYGYQIETINRGEIWDLKVNSNYWPMPFAIQNAGSHKYFNVSGNDNHAILINGSLSNNGSAIRINGDYGQIGFSNDWIDFNGTDQYLKYNRTPGLITKAYYSIIINPNTDTLGYIFDNTVRLIKLTGGNIQLDDSEGNSVITSVPTGSQTHILGMWEDGVGLELWVNGISVGTIATEAISTINNDIWLGKRSIGNYYNGTIQRLQIFYNINLTTQQITDLSNGFILDFDLFKNFTYTEGVANEQLIPPLSTNITKDILGNSLIVQQDGYSFLNTGTKLQAYHMPRLVQAEQSNRFFTDINDDVVDVNFVDFTGIETGDQDFNDISVTDKIKNIRKHKKPLAGRQLITEKIITNN